MTNDPLTICMVSDFFHPSIGGVETHIFQLSRVLIQLGHRVIVITTRLDSYNGIHYLPLEEGKDDALKVYYLPVPKMYNGSTWPTFYSTLPLLHLILHHERVSLIHAHQAFSTLAHETLLHARTMGIPTVFTDHSLFGFADGSSIITNKWLKFTMGDVGRVICVSHCSKENTVLRAAIDPDKVFVIPNAVLTDSFLPNPSNRDTSFITIVILSRLVYRKGCDLLVDVMPIVCSKYPNVRFIIGGDGPKRIALEQAKERHLLHDRIEFLGSLPPSHVPSILTKGDIFLNTSLTEAFCMAIVEAASCGLRVVSTRVGGVPEVLPQEMLRLARPEVGDLVHAIDETIAEVRWERMHQGGNKVNKKWTVELERFDRFHEMIMTMYSWRDVAARTLLVYQDLLSDSSCGETPLLERLALAYGCGKWGGVAFCCVVVLDCFLVFWLDWWRGVGCWEDEGMES
jgi:phosphatidylinositol N-acetylglucosaminyltransferase subunit A